MLFIAGNGSCFAISADIEHPEEAWELVKFLAGPGSAGVDMPLDLQVMTPALSGFKSDPRFLNPDESPGSNKVAFLAGAGIRLGGHRVDGVQHGVENQIYGNIIYNNLAGGVKFVVDGQAMVCDNRLWDNAAGDSAGEFGGHYDPAQRCESDMDGKDINRDSG